MQGQSPFVGRGALAARWLGCGCVAAIFAWSVSRFYLPGYGFTYLIGFGGKNHAQFLPEVKGARHYEFPDSSGYDSQAYVQIAMHPRLGDPALATAVDNLPYRAHRILFEIIPWLIGGGQPRRIMSAYALQNVVCWMLLAALLFRWLPPASWGNFFRWAATLWSFGLIFSVRGALLDGPALLLASAAVALLESGRPWWGSLVLGISGLGKETSVLCGSALEPPAPRDPRAWAAWLGRVAVMLLPLSLWLSCLRLWLGPGGEFGVRNFSAPFAGVSRKLASAVSGLAAEGRPLHSVAALDLLVLVGLLAQFLFFASRIRRSDTWWRVGASTGLLMVFLGDAVWESYPSAAARVLLPMTLAFNICVPKRGWWPLLLIAGNLGVLASADLLNPPVRDEYYMVEGPRALRIDPDSGDVVEAAFVAGNWSSPERERLPGRKTWDYWRWSTGDASVEIHNPHPYAILADVSFGLATVDARAAAVNLAGKVVWRGMLLPARDNQAAIAEVELPPGDTRLLFTSDRAGASPGGGDPRALTFSVRNLKIRLRESR